MEMSEEDTTVYYGKYPGYVRDSDDPDGRGRLRLYVPDALGQDDDADHWTDWALPCFPWDTTQGKHGRAQSVQWSASSS